MFLIDKEVYRIRRAQAYEEYSPRAHMLRSYTVHTQHTRYKYHLSRCLSSLNSLVAAAVAAALSRGSRLESDLPLHRICNSNVNSTTSVSRVSHIHKPVCTLHQPTIYLVVRSVQSNPQYFIQADDKFPRSARHKNI